MAPRKRSRNPHDVDGEEEIEIESATSSFQSNNRNTKRTKIALAQAAGGSVVSDDEDGPFGDNYEEDFLNSDRGDTEVEDADEDEPMSTGNGELETEDQPVNELQATQYVREEMRKQQLRGNVVQENGVIETIYCTNFMCHTKLKIDLGPNINFIIGHNGSGKSAVLTALTMCLGGKATQTNRGANLKSLIKNGKDSASLTVRIKNQGEDAYKHDEYGDSILVERHFTKSGSSGFKLKPGHGKSTVSTKKSDLDDMLDFFGLQLDNPINVLTQDRARDFLSNSTPETKYKFFIRGTMLEALDSDYKVFEENLDNTNEKLRLRDSDIQILKQQKEEAERKRDQLRHAETLQQKIREVSRQHAWCQVEAEEETLQKYQQNVSAQEAVVQEKEEIATNFDATYEAADSAKEAANRAVEAVQEELGPAKEKHTKAKEAFDQNKEKITNINSEERDMRDKRKTKTARIAQLKKDIADEEARIAQNGGEEHVARSNRLEELKTVLAAAKDAQQEHAAKLPDLQRKEEDAKNLLREANDASREADTAVQAADQSLKQLQSAENRKYAPYSRNMEQLCKAIDRETRWKSKPVGPFGLHMQLTKPEWSSIIEKTFGGLLNHFAVTNRDDANIFNAMAARVGCNSSALISNDDPIDTAPHEPREGIDTILRVLKIDHPAVRKQLVIMHAIEQIVLIENRQEALKFAYPESGDRPHNVRAVLCLVDDRKVAGHRFDWSRMGAQRSNPVDRWQGPIRMQTSQEERLNMARRQLREAKDAYNDADERVRQCRTGETQARQAIVAHKRETMRLKTAFQEAENDVETLDNEIEKARPQHGKLDAYRDDLAEETKDKQDLEKELEDLYEQKLPLNAAAHELKTAADTALKELEVIQKRIQTCEKKAKDAEDRRHELLLEKNEKHDNVDFHKNQLTRLQQKVTDQQAHVDEFIEGATSICARVAVPHGTTTEILDERLKVFETQLETERRKAGGTEEQLQRAYTKAYQEYDEAVKGLKYLKSVSMLLKKTLQERHRRWGLFRKYITVRARIQFMYLLSERNFRGRVIMDHVAKKLDINVEPDLSRASDAGRTAKTLSGGEKSFSTICLLLSIWEAMGSPIRCLDEFDVFMDSVNRSQSIKMIIEAARRSAGRQFVFITPQSMGDVQRAPDVAIHKMSDPERGQTSLSFAE